MASKTKDKKKDKKKKHKKAKMKEALPEPKTTPGSIKSDPIPRRRPRRPGEVVGVVKKVRTNDGISRSFFCTPTRAEWMAINGEEA